MFTEEQITYLYKFCVQHYVRYYDVQIELVDHLANAVEEKIEADKNIDFETALNSVYAGFGRTGFSKIVSNKEKELRKETRAKLWKAFAAYFTIPKIVITVLLFMILLLPAYLFKMNIAKNILLITVLALYVGIAVYYFYTYFSVYKKPKKELISYKTADPFVFMSPLLIMPFNILNFAHALNFHGFNIWLYCLLIAATVFGILFSVAGFAVYKKNYKEIKNQYPLAFE